MLLGARIEQGPRRQARPRARAGRTAAASHAITCSWASASSRTRAGSTAAGLDDGRRARGPRGPHGGDGRLRGRRRRARLRPGARHATCAPTTGRRRRARAPRRRARCSASSRPAPRCRASGATSTASASSTSAAPPKPTASRSTAIPDGRDFEALFTQAGVPVAALLVGRPRALADARRRVQAGLDSLIPRQRSSNDEMQLRRSTRPHAAPTATARWWRRGVFEVEDVARVIGDAPRGGADRGGGVVSRGGDFRS